MHSDHPAWQPPAGSIAVPNPTWRQQAAPPLTPPPAAAPVQRAADPYAALAALGGGTTEGYEDQEVFERASRILDIPDVGRVYFPSKIPGKEIAAAFRAAKDHKQPPIWYLEALDAGIDPAQITYLPSLPEHPEVLKITTAISEGMPIELPSAFVTATFLASLILERRKTLTQTSGSRS
jgi:hypothetical protein